jgi:putative heme degradation protein
MKRWLSQVIVLLKVIITQSTEEYLLSRITQLGITGGLIGNIVDDEDLDVSDVVSESNPAKVRVMVFVGNWIISLYLGPVLRFRLFF